MYYLKLENAEDMGEGKTLVTSNGMTFMVPTDMVTTQQQAPPSDMGALLEHIQGLTSHIEGLSQPKVNFKELATNLNHVFENYPSKRNQVIKRVAGMVRGDMLYCKSYLCSDLRRAVLGTIMSRDSLNTSVVPPDLAAFVDDRPLNETLGSRDWDPGSEQAKDHVSSNWMESENIMNKISSEVDDSEFSHMYPNTSDVAGQVNRKFGATESKQ